MTTASLCHIALFLALSHQAHHINPIISAYRPFRPRCVCVRVYTCDVRSTFVIFSHLLQRASTKNEQNNHETFQHAQCMGIFVVVAVINWRSKWKYLVKRTECKSERTTNKYTAIKSMPTILMCETQPIASLASLFFGWDTIVSETVK